MTEEREDTLPLGFLTLMSVHIPNIGDLPPITTSTITARSQCDTPLANRASTSAILKPIISLTFVEANYEALKSLMKERRR